MTTTIRRTCATAAVAAALTVAFAGSASSHHSFAPFDLKTEKTVTGTVKQVEWTNPHTWVWLDVPNDQGGVDTWGFEGMSPNYLARRGWSRTTLKPGDRISVVFRPLKDGSKGGSFVRAKLANGQVLTMIGDPTDR
jgi:hypothetical protein